MGDYQYNAASIKTVTAASTWSVPTDARTRRTGAAADSTRSNAGLPARLKASIEYLSGMPMDEVRIHSDSRMPAALGVAAYTYGKDVYLAPGAEQHLAHEAWHVVQQMQGRVKPTLGGNGTPLISDDQALEREAENMGKRAARLMLSRSTGTAESDARSAKPAIALSSQATRTQPVIQCFSLTRLPKLMWAAPRGGRTFMGLTEWGDDPLVQLATAFYKNANGLSAADWVAIAGELAPDGVEETIAVCRIPGWSGNALTDLARQLRISIGERGPEQAAAIAQQWAEIARLVDKDAKDDVASFCTLPGWSPADIHQLTEAFASDRNGLSAQEWADAAQRIGKDRVKEVIVFCRLRGWTWTGIKPLIDAFATSVGKLKSTDWCNVALRMGKDQHEDTIEFCTMPDRAPNAAIALANAFATNRNGLEAKNWCEVAKLLKNTNYADITKFCWLPWDWAAIHKLTKAIADNPNGLKLMDWHRVAERMKTEDRANDTIAFCQLQGWTMNGIEQLAEEFVRDSNRLLSTRWASIAKLVGKDGHVGTTALCRLRKWSPDAIEQLATEFSQDPCGLTAQDWAKLAEKYPQKEAQAVRSILRAVPGKPRIDAILEYVEATPDAPHAERLKILKIVKHDGTLKSITQFIQTTRKHHQSTSWAIIFNLLEEIRSGSPETKITDVANLVAEIENGGTLSEIATLASNSYGHGSIGDLCGLVRSVKKYNGVASVGDIDQLLTACNHIPLWQTNSVKMIVEAVGENGSIVKIAEMVRTAAPIFDALTLPELEKLIKRNPSTNTPEIIKDFLNEVGDATRYAEVVSKISLFKRNKNPPNPPVRYYDAAGNVLPTKKNAEYACDRWKYFYKRHTYEYFDFQLARNRASQGPGSNFISTFWRDQINVVAEFDATLPQAVSQGWNFQPGPYWSSQPNGNGNEIGHNSPAPPKWITHFTPIRGQGKDDLTLSLAESNSIEPLR